MTRPFVLRTPWPLRAAGLVFCLIMAGCGTLGGKPAPDSSASDPAARQIIETLLQRNARLQSFKGIGNLKLHRNNASRVQERMAWVGAAPSRLSVVVFASGRPALKLATNGKRLYLLDFYNPKRNYYESAAPNFALKRLVAVPLKPEEMVTLLSGRIPIVDYRTARMIPDVEGSGIIVSLAKRAGTLQKIYIDQTRVDVRKSELFNNSGKLIYRVEFESYRDIQNYRVPFVMRFSDDDGNRMELAIDRFLADVEVDPSMFVLEPPENQ